MLERRTWPGGRLHRLRCLQPLGDEAHGRTGPSCGGRVDGTAKRRLERSRNRLLYDVDGSGEIDEHELLLAFKSLGFDSKPAEVRKMVALYDTDGNGEMDESEFLKLVSDLIDGTFDEKVAPELAARQKAQLQQRSREAAVGQLGQHRSAAPRGGEPAWPVRLCERLCESP